MHCTVLHFTNSEEAPVCLDILSSAGEESKDGPKKQKKKRK